MKMMFFKGSLNASLTHRPGQNVQKQFNNIIQYMRCVMHLSLLLSAVEEVEIRLITVKIKNYPSL